LDALLRADRERERVAAQIQDYKQQKSRFFLRITTIFEQPRFKSHCQAGFASVRVKKPARMG
jgi:hypothetical protein